MCDLTLFKNSWQFFGGEFSGLGNKREMQVKDFCGKNVPKLPDFNETISEIAIFGQFCFSQNIAGFLKFSTFLFDLEKNLANS